MTQVPKIEKLEADLWVSAHELRVNSHKFSSQDCMPCSGSSSWGTPPIATTPPALKSPRNKLPSKCPSTRSTTAILKRRALILPNEARYDEFMRLHKEDFGDALVLPMNAIERESEPLQDHSRRTTASSNPPCSKTCSDMRNSARPRTCQDRAPGAPRLRHPLTVLMSFFDFR